jgi:hypothetical protein
MLRLRYAFLDSLGRGRARVGASERRLGLPLVATLGLEMGESLRIWSETVDPISTQKIRRRLRILNELVSTHNMRDSAARTERKGQRRSASSLLCLARGSISPRLGSRRGRRIESQFLLIRELRLLSNVGARPAHSFAKRSRLFGPSAPTKLLMRQLRSAATMPKAEKGARPSVFCDGMDQCGFEEF